MDNTDSRWDFFLAHAGPDTDRATVLVTTGGGHLIWRATATISESDSMYSGV